MNLEELVVTDAFLIAKILILIFLFLYIIFAIVIIKQVKLMTDTLDVDLDGFVRFISYLHLFFACVVFAIALFIL